MDACYQFCPTGYLPNTGTNTCDLQNQLSLHATFTEVHIALKNQASTSPTFVASAPAPLPLKGRGNYFDGSSYWTTETEPVYVYHSFAIISWIKCPTINSNMTVFSKNKPNSTTAGEESLLNFGITTDSKVQLEVDDGTTPLYSILSDSDVSLDTWTQIAVRVEYSTRSTINWYINKTTNFAQSDVGVFYQEYLDSLTSIGQKWFYNGTFQASSFFSGYIYDLKVYNVAWANNSIVGAVEDTTCTVGCTFCPAEDDECISECPTDFLEENCATQCDGFCPDNCVRTDDLCSQVCDDLLCEQCETFDNGTCFDCKDNTLDPANTSGVCECNSTSVLKTPEYICTCHENCTACQDGLTQYHCSVCVSGYYKQVGASFCLDYCGTGYTQVGQSCLGSNTHQMTRYNLVQSDPQTYKHRGIYFGSCESRELDDDLHHTGTFDTFIRPLDLSGTQVIFSINRATTSVEGEEDFLTFSIENQSSSSGKLTVSFSEGTSELL